MSENRSPKKKTSFIWLLASKKSGPESCSHLGMKDEASILRQLRREQAFEPPYCPRTKCKNHAPEKARSGFSAKHGRNPIKRFPYQATRFRCRDCNKTFTFSFFKLYYRNKVWGLDEEIDRLDNLGASKRAIAREIQHDERLVRDRLVKMSRWGMLFQAKSIQGLNITEAIVYDGLENFSFSQFDPNNINHAVGKTSLFTYDFNFSPMNRKGKMSDVQAARRRELEEEFGPYPRDSIRTATKKVVQRLVRMAKGTLVLYSDKHYMYKRVMEVDLAGCKIEHITVSSKIHRNYQNPLFAVNNVDLQARQNAAPFKRETISFSKHSIAMQESFMRFILRRNYRRPKFWGTHRSDPECAKRSPAMELGLTKKILSFKDFYAVRVLPMHVNLNPDWKNLYDHHDPYSRRAIAV